MSGLAPQQAGETIDQPIDNEELGILNSSFLEVLVVLALVVFAWTLDSALHPRIENSDLNNVAVMVAKDLDPTLYPTDYTFADSASYQTYTPLYRWLIARLWQASGSFELGLVWLVPAVLLIYLGGMLGLLYGVTKNVWLALGLTVAAAHYHELIGAEVWGVAGSSLMFARTIFLVSVPFLIGWFLLILPQPPSLRKGAMLGLGIGLAANLHPPSGLHLAVLVAAALILRHGLRFDRDVWRSWAMAGVMFIGFVLGAWPTSQNFAGDVAVAGPTEVPFSLFSQAIRDRYPFPYVPSAADWPWAGLRPGATAFAGLVWLYAGLALAALGLYIRDRWWPLPVTWYRWLWLSGGLLTVLYAYMIARFEMGVLFALIGLYVIYRFRAGTIEQLDGWLMSLAALVIVQALVGYYLLAWLWETFELPSLTLLYLYQLRAVRFIYVPIYLLAGRAAVAWVHEMQAGLDWLKNVIPTKGRDLPHGQEMQAGLGRLKRAESPLGVKTTRRGALFVLAGLALSLSPGLSAHLRPAHPLLGVVALLVITGLLIVLAGVVERLPLPRRWVAVGGVFVVGSVLFGPPGAKLAPYLPAPAINLLDAQARISQPLWSEADRDLYAWVRANTSPEALFYWCDFGPVTTLYFRRQAQRSLTHHWKDTGWAVYDEAHMVAVQERYRQLTGACHDQASLLAMAQQVQADYLLMPTAKAAELRAASCFANDRYLVFGLGAQACIQP